MRPTSFTGSGDLLDETPQPAITRARSASPNNGYPSRNFWKRAIATISKTFEYKGDLVTQVRYIYNNTTCLHEATLKIKNEFLLGRGNGKQILDRIIAKLDEATNLFAVVDEHNSKALCRIIRLSLDLRGKMYASSVLH